MKVTATWPTDLIYGTTVFGISEGLLNVRSLYIIERHGTFPYVLMPWASD